MVKIFNGEKEIEVGEGSIFNLKGVWNLGTSDSVVFQLDNNIEMITKVVNLTSYGTDFKVISIKANDPLEQIKADSIDAEEIEVELNLGEYGDEEVVLEIDSKSTKKQLISIIDTYNLNIDKKLTKKNIIEALEKIDNIKIV